MNDSTSIDTNSIRKWCEEYNKQKVADDCPHCGRCKHCGRGGLGQYPTYPWYPYNPYPLWTISTFVSKGDSGGA